MYNGIRFAIYSTSDFNGAYSPVLLEHLSMVGVFTIDSFQVMIASTLG